MLDTQMQSASQILIVRPQKRQASSFEVSLLGGIGRIR